MKPLSLITLAVLTSSPVAAMTEGEITIWINGDKSYEGLAKKIGQQFEEDTGVKVIVQHPESLESRFEKKSPLKVWDQTSSSGHTIALAGTQKRVC
ncbi:hypothetical protein QW180_26980 [Vibrio sinaloensis]|nr:hypothetical protein [Vibrio sinaloensis]